MTSPEQAEQESERPDRVHAYTEYGVIVDRGMGFYLAHVSRDQKTAEQMAQGFGFAQPARLEDEPGTAQTYPVEIKMRRVYMSDWQPLPGGSHDQP
jgi:hypothetical protein